LPVLSAFAVVDGAQPWTLSLGCALSRATYEQDDASPLPQHRPSWTELFSRLSDNKFRKNLQMPYDEFEYLCDKLKESVGESIFRSGEYLDQQPNNRLDDAMVFCGGALPGEVRVAICLRMMAGG
jgi:hypothetical protein